MDNTQLTAEQLLQQQLGGNGSTDGVRRPLMERLHDKFRGDDIITIKNPFDFDTGWVYSDPKDIQITQPDKYTQRIDGIGNGYQKARVLKAGKSIRIPGWEGYIAIVRFFKDWCQRNHQSGLSAAMNSEPLQNEFVDKVYGGIYDPNADEVVEEKVAAKKELEDDLGLSEKPAKETKPNTDTTENGKGKSEKQSK